MFQNVFKRRKKDENIGPTFTTYISPQAKFRYSLPPREEREIHEVNEDNVPWL